jgi:arylsulfatase A-like enzyme
MTRFFLPYLLLIACIMPLAGTASAAEQTSASKPNILLIISDDLNDWIGPMKGNAQAKTPNLDKLAARGMVFRNNQCAAPLCNPSRVALMSGMRPSTTGVYHNQQEWRDKIGRGLCLNDYIRSAGYQSLGAGKIYHYKRYRPEDWDKVVFAADDTLPNHPAKRSPGPFGYRMFTEDEPQKPFEEKRAESQLVDFQSVSWCVDRLGDAKQPFFMACGIHRPHTPWDIPKKYFDLYPIESIKLPEVKANDLDDVPAKGKEFAGTSPDKPHARILQMKLWKDRVRAYLACVSYADARVGQLLDALDKSPQRDNTIVIFVGDHGWHLGEKEHWGKVTMWNEAVRTPMIWVVPGLTPAGSECFKGVDMMSIYPTVCELIGAPVPKHVEGVSIKPLLKDPKAKWDTPALSTMYKGNHSISDGEWRYIHYSDGTEELYDEQKDPNEWTNLASKPELAEIKRRLGAFMPKKEAEPVPVMPEPGKPRRRGGPAGDQATSGAETEGE